MSHTPRRAVLLSAGLGTRLRPLTDTTPKCLVRIHGKPLLGYWLDQVMAAGIERAIVNTHYLPEQVRAFCNTSRWADRIDLFHEPEILGTAGTVRALATQLLGQGPAFIAHADNLSVFDLAAFSAAHAARPTDCLGTMMTFITDRPKDCGIVELDRSGVVQRVFEKVENPPGNLANAAVFIIEEAIVRWVADHPDVFDFCRDVVPPLAGRWFTFFNGTFHRDIGTQEALAKAEAEYSWDRR
ncbi:MAG: nucleotidyltransferase family protein [Alphaproteobacteria bacterium]|nr:nucleotidyltransferase family protein [Alphaproteobacteria bacterium]